MVASPRKRRTRQHIIADLSVHHLEGFILEEGHIAERTHSDYGYDLVMRTFDESGFAETGTVHFQLKASEALRSAGAELAYDVDVRDYNLWKHEEMPVILVLYDASKKAAYWLAIQVYLREGSAQQPKKGAKTVRVRIPRTQIVNRAAIATIRALKPQAHGFSWRVIG